MLDGFSDAQVIGALVGFIVVSYFAFFGWLVMNLHSLHKDMVELNREERSELGGRIDAVANQLGGRIDILANKVDGLVIAVSRLEGAVYHGLPEPRRAAGD